MLGLVLTAGGARGAYQAGVLKRIGEIPALGRRTSPFRIIAGASAGAINGSMVAASSADLRAGTQKLADLWADLTVKQVFHADPISLGSGGLRWVRDLALGGLIGGGTVQSLVDATPLRAHLTKHLPLGGIAEAVRKNQLYAVAISATSYHSGKSFTFIQGQPGHPLWIKSRRVALAVELTLDHVLASAAIPVVFPPVQITSEVGECFFGDGGLRLVTPFSPAIRLGASRVFAVGIRCHSSADALSRAELHADEESHGGLASIVRPPLAQILGVFMNAIFLDHLDADLDHLRRMNELIAASAHTNGTRKPRKNGAAVSEPMRQVEPMVINPSSDLAIVAAAFSHKMPRAVRYVLDGLGTPNAQSADLMSYLLFDSSYTRALIDIGYQDAHARIDEIEAFLTA
ncbi:MAG: patatin-like phospholipase family protein [Candidatus Binatia bacterium]